jgi:hypothetical protein
MKETKLKKCLKLKRFKNKFRKHLLGFLIFHAVKNERKENEKV